jgi:hypothetical protein
MYHLQRSTIRFKLPTCIVWFCDVDPCLLRGSQSTTLLKSFNSIHAQVLTQLGNAMPKLNFNTTDDFEFVDFRFSWDCNISWFSIKTSSKKIYAPSMLEHQKHFCLQIRAWTLPKHTQELHDSLFYLLEFFIVPQEYVQTHNGPKNHYIRGFQSITSKLFIRVLISN